MQLLDLRAKIPVVDFGGTGPIILFSHANGYPPRVYRDLLTRLTREYRVLGLSIAPFGSKTLRSSILGNALPTMLPSFSTN